MNRNLLGAFRNHLLAGICALVLAGCSISKIPVEDFGKYRANIFFQFGSSKVTEESSSNLEVIVATVKQYLESTRRGKPRNVLIEIWGDASEEKTQKGKLANKKIKEARAQIVANELASIIQREGLTGIELKVVSGPEVEEEATSEEKERGYKRAVVDVTFKQQRKSSRRLFVKKKDEAISDETNEKVSDKKRKGPICRLFSKKKNIAAK